MIMMVIKKTFLHNACVRPLCMCAWNLHSNYLRPVRLKVHNAVVHLISFFPSLLSSLPWMKATLTTALHALSAATLQSVLLPFWPLLLVCQLLVALKYEVITFGSFNSRNISKAMNSTRMYFNTTLNLTLIALAPEYLQSYY